MKKHIFILFLITISFFFMGCNNKSETEDISIDNRGPLDIEEIVKITHSDPLQSVDIVLIIDQSSSMSGYGNFPATDPYEMRIKASHYLVNNISVKSASEIVPRVGVVHFGTDAPLNAQKQLTYLNTDLKAQEINNSVLPMDLVWTNFLSAFKAAHDQFIEADTFKENRKAAIILLTDGEPSDLRNLSNEAYFQELDQFFQENFAPNNVDIFIIGIDAADMLWSDYYDRWLSILPTEDSSLYHLLAMEDLPEVYNDIVRSIFRIPGIEPDTIYDDKELEFYLPAYLEWVEFHIFPETEELSLSIVKPDGSLITEADTDTEIRDYGSYTIVVIKNPQPGKWFYSIEKGQGKIEVYRNIMPIRIQLQSPQPQLIFGKSEMIAAEFSRLDGAPMIIHPDYPVQIELTVTDPQGQEEHEIMSELEPGLYKAKMIFEPDKEGLYSITLSVYAAEAFSYSDQYTVEVLKIPYLFPIIPKPGEQVRVGSEVNVEVALYEGFNDIVDPSEYFETTDTALVIAWFEPAGKERSKAYYIHPTDTKGVFSGTLPYQVTQGTHQIRFRIVGNLLDGKPYAYDELVVSFSGVVPLWLYMIICFIVIITVAAAIKLFLFIRQPAWEGRIKIEKGTANERILLDDIYLSKFGKKKYITLGPKCDINIDDPEYQDLYGKFVLKYQETDLGSKFVPILSYKINKDDLEATQEFIMEGDTIYLCNHIIRYYYF